MPRTSGKSHISGSDGHLTTLTKFLSRNAGAFYTPRRYRERCVMRPNESHEKDRHHVPWNRTYR